MSSFDSHPNSAESKRAEQLKRWEESETNRHNSEPTNLDGRKVKFSSGCIFLAACMSGDKDEVLRLLATGADIDTANVDGLTALHQACIDDDLDMVEFLVQNGADINRQDNEGWTPLHATSSCGFASIARYLIENGASLETVSSDCELVIDVAINSDMELLLQKYMDEQGIDSDEARKAEEKLMLNDAKNWLRSDASEADKPHPRTGATALHVAAAKGYCKVLSLLLATRADVDKQDNDGWTPLHAAAHWGQTEAAQMLVASLADMDVKNYSGQAPIDVADPNIVRFLEDLRKSRRTKRRPISQIRINDNLNNHIDTTPAKVIRYDGPDKTEVYTGDDKLKSSLPTTEITTQPILKDGQNTIEEDTPWRRSNSLRTKPESPPKINVPDKDTASSPPTTTQSNQSSDSEVILRRTQSFENDKEFYKKYIALRARIKANSCPTLPASQITGTVNNVNNKTNNYSVQRSASLKDYKQLRKSALSPIAGSSSSVPSVVTSTPTTNAGLTATTPPSGQIRSPSPNDPKLPPKFGGSITNLAVHPDISNKINQTRALFGGSAMQLNKIPPLDQLAAPRQASSVTDLAVAALNGRYGDRPPPLPPKVTTTVTISSTTLPSEQKVESEQAISAGSVQLTSINEPGSNDDGQGTNAIQLQSLRSKFAPGNIFKNFFKSFAPPVRDEESETQRKAHAKRVRETRRSTQGVTLDEIKSAEELVKKKNLNNNNNSETSTPPTTSTPINDRVPLIKSDDGIINNRSLPTSSSLDKSAVASADIVTPSSPDPQISATYTLTAPKHDPQLDKKHQQITATYTIATPPSVAGQSENGAAIVTATLSMPSTLPQKTDLEALTRTASPTCSKLSLQLDDSKKMEQDDQTKSPPSKPSTPTVDFTLNRSNRGDKRSLFDIDNASSLTLADKLRNEANKYTESSGQQQTANANDSSDGTPEAVVIRRQNDSTNPVTMAERRPSWRLKFDAGSKFKLEDATSSPSTDLMQRRTSNTTTSTGPPVSIVRPVSAPVSKVESSSERVSEPMSPTNEVTISLRRAKSKDEDKENDKENDSRSAQATQAVIQRRRRPKRRSTGVVHVDMDDIDPDRQESPIDGDDKEISGTERTSAASDNQSENGVIDYKALYEAARIDIERMKTVIKKKDEELVNAKAAIDRFANATTKNSLSELEKRERRAMERKLSELEEELKEKEALKTENQRLKDENGALIRVISKLSK